MGMREMAIRAHEEAKAKQAEERRRRLAEAADEAVRRMKSYFGIEAQPDPETGTAIVDGLRFEAGSYGSLLMHISCPRCGTQGLVKVDSLADIGGYLVGERELFCPTCTEKDGFDFERELVRLLGSIVDYLAEIARQRR